MVAKIDEIFETLKKEIINLDLTPGTKIKEEELAARFNISRTPIRSVIACLESDGLVDVVPQKGTYVSKISYANIADLIYVRKVIEMQVISEIINIINEDQIKVLEDILKSQEEIVLKEDSIEKSKEFFHNDNLFHKTLFSFADKEGVWKIIHTNATALNRVRIMSNLRNHTEVEKVYEQHMQLLECLKKHDLSGAKEVFVMHIDGGFEGIDVVKEKYEDYFI